MGFEGLVLAVGTLFVLAFVVPQISRKRAVVAQTPIAERYSADLRMIATNEPNQDDGDHGKIFTTERTMSQSIQPSNAETARKIARERARARARIATRASYQKRALVTGLTLGLVAIAAWVLVFFSVFGAIWAGSASILAGLYVVATGYLISAWSIQNAADEKTIAKANRALRKSAPVAKEAPKAAPVAAGISVPAEERDSVAHQGKKAAQSKPVAGKTVESATQSRKVASQPAATQPAATQPAASQPAASQPAAPAYTLKPQKRQVKPYEAPEERTAAVPYRPKRTGERIGNQELEPANTLRGGATLDALLDRRRA